jgi:hypothetical protein
MDIDSVSMAVLSHITVNENENENFDDPLVSSGIVSPLGSIYSRD